VQILIGKVAILIGKSENLSDFGYFLIGKVGILIGKSEN
jgi:hypothetical protein